VDLAAADPRRTQMATACRHGGRDRQATNRRSHGSSTRNAIRERRRSGDADEARRLDDEDRLRNAGAGRPLGYVQGDASS